MTTKPTPAQQAAHIAAHITARTMTHYNIICSNIGTVHRCKNHAEGMKVFRHYVKLSKAPHGRASGEEVTIFANGEPLETYLPTTPAAAIAAKIQAARPRGAWNKAVQTYALELLEDIEDHAAPITAAALLNGARTWQEYSYGGSALIYDADIAERLCSPSELRRKRCGELPPSIRETWLDCQARALRQAARLIMRNA